MDSRSYTKGTALCGRHNVALDFCNCDSPDSLQVPEWVCDDRDTWRQDCCFSADLQQVAVDDALYPTRAVHIPGRGSQYLPSSTVAESPVHGCCGNKSADAARANRTGGTTIGSKKVAIRSMVAAPRRPGSIRPLNGTNYRSSSQLHSGTIRARAGLLRSRRALGAEVAIWFAQHALIIQLWPEEQNNR